MCKENNKYYTTEINILDNFCVNSYFIIQKLSDIQNSVHCDSILNDMSTRKNMLISVYEEDARERRFTRLKDKCSTEFF